MYIFKPTGKDKTYKCNGKTFRVPAHWWTAWIGGAHVPSLAAASERTLRSKMKRAGVCDSRMRNRQKEQSNV